MQSRKVAKLLPLSRIHDYVTKSGFSYEEWNIVNLRPAIIEQLNPHALRVDGRIARFVMFKKEDDFGSCHLFDFVRLQERQSTWPLSGVPLPPIDRAWT